MNTVVITQLNLLRKCEDLGVQFVSYRQASVQLSMLTLQASILEEIRVNQDDDLELQRMKQNLMRGKLPEFVVHEDGTLRFRIACVYPKM